MRWNVGAPAHYRLTIAEERNYWSRGCTWVTVVSDGIVTESTVDASSTSNECRLNDWTVERLHGMIARWLADVDRYPASQFGEHTLEVQFDEMGVPVAMQFDLANGNDEESVLRVTFAALPRG